MTHPDTELYQDLERVLIDRDAIAERVAGLASEIERGLDAVHHADGGPPDGDLVLVPVLTGAMIFVADLIRHLPRQMRIEVTTASSYHGGTTSSGTVDLGPLPADLAGCDVLLVDDILDSGRTLAALRDAISARGPRSLRTCVLLRKDVPRAEAVAVEHVGFDIPDAFVVGYGLDFDGRYRNLPDIGVLRADRV